MLPAHCDCPEPPKFYDCWNVPPPINTPILAMDRWKTVRTMVATERSDGGYCYWVIPEEHHGMDYPVAWSPLPIDIETGLIGCNQ